MQGAKKRSGLLAAVFNFLFPGLGFFYAGSWVLAFAYLAILVILVVVFFQSQLVYQPAGFAFILGLLLLFSVVASLYAFAYARMRSPLYLRPFQRWYYYVLFIAAVLMGSLWLQEQRDELFGFDFYRVPSSSMEPTLMPNDYVVADATAYELVPPKRGDIVVFIAPQKESLFTKGVLGLPGERVKISRGDLFINGVKLKQPWLERSKTMRSSLLSTDRIILPNNHYFVMGDNRDNSFDSRYFGAIEKSLIKGKIRRIVISVNLKKGVLRWDRIGIVD